MLKQKYLRKARFAVSALRRLVSSAAANAQRLLCFEVGPSPPTPRDTCPIRMERPRGRWMQPKYEAEKKCTGTLQLGAIFPRALSLDLDVADSIRNTWRTQRNPRTRRGTHKIGPDMDTSRGPHESLLGVLIGRIPCFSLRRVFHLQKQR